MTHHITNWNLKKDVIYSVHPVRREHRAKAGRLIREMGIEQATEMAEYSARHAFSSESREFWSLVLRALRDGFYRL